MRPFRILLLLPLLAPLGLRAQMPVVLPPGAAEQIMTPQPPVDVSQAGNVSATAEFDAPTVAPGEKTFYRVAVEATENSINWPAAITAPPGLSLGESVRGQVSRVEGNTFHPLTSFVYEVTAGAAGHYVIPNFTVPVGDKFVEVPAAALDVVAGNAIIAEPTRRLWLEVSPTNLFFGQPFRVRVLLPAGPNNQVEALREVGFNGTGFMTDKIATRQSVELVKHNGQQKLAYFYETIATPLAAGAVAMSAQGFTAGRDFGGSISISGNGQPVVIAGGPPKYLLLSSEVLHLNVRPLPVEGELPGFTGALGKFTADKPLLATNRLRVGEPVHLKYNFSAGTNLTRFVPPETPVSRDWQIIADQAPGNGFTLIPQTDEVTATPAVPFSAFDPVAQKYYDLTIPALPVTVLGDGLPVQLPAWSADDTNAAPLKLSNLATGPGQTVTSLAPLQLQAWFVFLLLLPVYLFFRLWQWDERRRFLEAHPEIVRLREAKRDLRREKSRMQSAAAAGEVEKFVQHAAAALRIAVAPHFPATASALVGGDVLSQLDATARSGPPGDTVRKIFAAADARFATTPPVGADLPALRSAVEAVLQQLEDKL